MSNIEKIKAEIERRKKICEGIFERESDTYYQGKAVAYGELLPFIDSLPEEKPSEDLEEAAEKYADKHGFRVPYDGSNNYYDDVDVKASREGFLAGAEWMRKKDVEDMYMSDNRHFLKCYEQGKVDMKVAMTKDAVDAEITVGRLPDDWSLAYNPDELHRALLKFKSGDKVKIIIVKQ